MRFPAWLVLLTMFLCPAAFAQNRPPHFELIAEGGASILNSGSATILPTCLIACSPTYCPPCASGTATSSFTKAGRLFTGARFRFTRHDAVEASYSFSPNRFSLQQGTATKTSVYNRVDLVSINYVHYLWTKIPVQPFATAGLGLNRFSGGQATMCVTMYPSPCIQTNNDNGFQFAWNFGGGTDIVLQRHFALRLELRDYLTGQPSFINGTSHNIVPSAGIVFRFK
jgi:hypothetical protein